MSQSQTGFCGAYDKGRSEYYTESDERDNYNKKCKQAFLHSLETHGGFRLVSSPEYANVRVDVTNFEVEEVITSKKDPDYKDCFYLHEISASIQIDLYMNGEKIDAFARSESNSQDIVANDKNTGYRIDNTLISPKNIMKRACNDGAYTVISKVSKLEKRQ